MKEWKCAACGYVYSGDEKPEKCPACGVDSDMLHEVSGKQGMDTKVDEKSEAPESEKQEKGASGEKKWQCTVCNYIHIGPEPPETCPICGADSSFFVELTEEKQEEKKEEVQAVEENDIQDKKEENARQKSKTTEPKQQPPPSEGKTFGILGRLVVHFNLHPISVHTPNGVLPIAFVFLLLSVYFHYSALEMASFFNLIVVVLAMPLVFATGFITWHKKYRGAKTYIFKTKLTCTAIVAVLVSLMVFWRFIDPEVALSGGKGSWIYLGLGGVALAAAGIAGHLGGKLVFGKTKK